MTAPVCTCNLDGRYGDTPGHYSGTLATLRASCAEHGRRCCAVVGCEREAVKAGFCAPCWEYAYVTLANKRYRTETPPAAPGAGT